MRKTNNGRRVKGANLPVTIRVQIEVFQKVRNMAASRGVSVYRFMQEVVESAVAQGGINA